MRRKIYVRKHRRAGKLVRAHTRKIKKNYGSIISYGPNIKKKGQTGLTVNDVEYIIKNDPELYEQTKKADIIIEEYETPKEFGKGVRSEAFLRLNKKDNKPVIFLQALPGKGQDLESHIKKVDEELRHELKHMDQFRDGRLKLPEKPSLIINKGLEKEAIKAQKKRNYGSFPGDAYNRRRTKERDRERSVDTYNAFLNLTDENKKKYEDAVGMKIGGPFSFRNPRTKKVHIVY